MFYVVRDSEKLPPSIISEENYFAWYNPMRKDHRVEFRGSMNQCYDYVSTRYSKTSQGSIQGFR